MDEQQLQYAKQRAEMLLADHDDQIGNPKTHKCMCDICTVCRAFLEVTNEGDTDG